jgi:uncharacterized membrane protein required for colicin V production
VKFLHGASGAAAPYGKMFIEWREFKYNMNAVLDIIIVGLIIFCVAFGYRNGFVKTVMNFLSFIIAFFMAKTFSPQLSSMIYNGYIQPNFVAKVTAQIEKILGNVSLNHMVQDPNRPDDFMNMLKSYGVELPDVNKWLSEAASKSAADLNGYVAKNLVEPVAEGISYFIAFTAILLLSILLLKIVTMLINRAVKLPVLNFINRTGGIALGFLYGVSLSYIFVFLAYYVFPYLAANTSIGSVQDIVNDTIFFKWFYEHSPVDYIMSLTWF